MKMYRLRNTVQRYAWGSVGGLESALGIPNPEGKPAAELWMGAHPGAPSIAMTESGPKRLDDLITSDPEGCLGSDLRSRFGDVLPFLFKGLSAGTPLSIQTHPDKNRAEAGFSRENAAGIPLNSPLRTYRDDNHKPEMTLALTRFEGLCGFRNEAGIRKDLELVLGTEAARSLYAKEGSFLRGLVGNLLGLHDGDRKALLAKAREGTTILLDSWHEAKPGPDELPLSHRQSFVWVARLLELYPEDAGALMPLVLNHLVLQPGEAVFIGAGIMHAYLKGTALEIMANSDNVIRGGLTPKHIDLAELMDVVDFRAGLPEKETPSPGASSSRSEETWPIHTPEFILSRIVVGGAPPSMVDAGTMPEKSTPIPFGPELQCEGPEIILCADGDIHLSCGGTAYGEIGLGLTKGECAFIRADAGSCRLEGSGTAYRARVAPASLVSR